MSRKGGPHLRPEDPDARFGDAVKAKLREYDEAIATEQEAANRADMLVVELNDLGVSAIDLLETR